MIILRIVGAIVGGFVATMLLGGGDYVNGFNLGSILVAFIGAVILLMVVRAFSGSRSRV